MKMCWHILHFSFGQFVHDFKVSGKIEQYSPKKGFLFSFRLTFYLRIYEDKFLFGPKNLPIIFEFNWYHTNFLDIHLQSCFLPNCSNFDLKLQLKISIGLSTLLWDTIWIHIQNCCFNSPFVGFQNRRLPGLLVFFGFFLLYFIWSMDVFCVQCTGFWMIKVKAMQASTIGHALSDQ